MNHYLNSINLKAGSNFPLIVAEADMNHMVPRTPGFHIFHHHVDFQFLLVEKGDLLVKTLEQEVTLHQGECVFINSEVVHLVWHGPTCHNKSYIFPKELVSFYPGSPCEADVNRLASLPSLSLYVFDQTRPWCREIRNQLQEIAEVYQEETENPYYAYHLLTLLAELWLNLLTHIESPVSQQKTETARRMQEFLFYIETHYQESITLSAIATSANVSPSECLRCFKALMHTTPHQYLIEYRLSKAAELLKKTDRPITEIAYAVGFHQISHFGKWFREKLGMSPREYRKSVNS